MEPNTNRITSSPMKGKTAMNKDSSSSVTDSEDDDSKRKRVATGGGGSTNKKGSYAAAGNSMKSCQAERCSADLSGAKTYHRRHKVCELHAKAQVVLVAGTRQRFCQQCSRFHELSEFDDSKRSCRVRLAGHNERRRKNFADNNNNPQVAGESSGTDGGWSLQFTVQENANYKQCNVMR